MEYGIHPSSVAGASIEERSSFITRTYVHLFCAVLLFCALEATWFLTGLAEPMLRAIAGGGRLGWMLVLGGFVGVSMLADRWARSETSPAVQYAGLGFYVFAESLVFVPMIAMAMMATQDFSLLGEAGLTTLVLFGGLTGVVLITRKDFSFMRGILMFGGFAGIGFIGASLLFGFTLGLAFSWAMLALACGYILYQTSGILLHYRTDQHVSAALALFSSLAMLFWYVLRIFTSRRS